MIILIIFMVMQWIFLKIYSKTFLFYYCLLIIYIRESTDIYQFLNIFKIFILYNV